MPLNINSGTEFAAAFETGGPKDLVLTKNITLPRTWNSPEWPDAVTIDGGKHTISTSIPLFTSVGAGSQFKQTEVRFTYQGSESNIGAFLRDQKDRAALINCSVSGAIHNNSRNIGAFAGRARGTLFRNCVNKASLFAKNNVGGICGTAKFCRFFLCKNNAAVLGTKQGSSGLGGICGNADGACLMFCQNNARVEGHDSVGGIAGLTAQCIVQSCRNDGIIKTLNADDQMNVGGVVGHPTDTLILDSRNDAEYVGNTDNTLLSAGGVAGFTVHSVVFGNRNTSPVYGYSRSGSNSTAGAGGIVGTLVDDADVGPSLVKGNWQEANVKGRVNVGGIVGSVRALEHETASQPDAINGNRVCTGTSIVGDQAVAGILGAVRYTLASGANLKVLVHDNTAGSDIISAAQDVYRISGGLYDGSENSENVRLTSGDASIDLKRNRANPDTRLDGENALPGGGEPEPPIDPYEIDPYSEYPSAFSDDYYGGNPYEPGNSIIYKNDTVGESDPWYGASKQHGENVEECEPGYEMTKCLACETSTDACPVPVRRNAAAKKAPNRPAARPVPSGTKLTTKEAQCKSFHVGCSVGTYLTLKNMRCSEYVPPPPPPPSPSPGIVVGNAEIQLVSRIASIPIAGAQFTLTGPEDSARGHQVRTTFTTGENGELVLCNLSPGTYTVTQTSTPKGWQTIAPIKITVASDGGVTVNGGDGKTIRADADPMAFSLYTALPAQTKNCFQKA